MSKFLKSLVLSALWSVLCIAAAPTVRAHSEVSEASALSMLPVAVSVAAPAMVLSGGVALTVVSIQASAVGTVWVLERASDGTRMTLQFSGQVLTGAVLSAGTAVVVTTLATGWVLSAAGQAIAFIPNEIGRSLLHNERITR